MLALALALALDRSVRGVALYRATFYLPSLLGASVAIAVLWRQIFGGQGLVNQLLMLTFGVSGPAWVSRSSESASPVADSVFSRARFIKLVTSPRRFPI